MELLTDDMVISKNFTTFATGHTTGQVEMVLQVLWLRKRLC